MKIEKEIKKVFEVWFEWKSGEPAFQVIFADSMEEVESIVARYTNRPIKFIKMFNFEEANGNDN